MNDNLLGPIIIGVLLLGLGGAMVVRYKEDSTRRQPNDGVSLKAGTRRKRNISRRK
jgi:hypothetical protein